MKKIFSITMLLLFFALPVSAESESRNAGIVQELKSLSGKIEEIRNQNKQILQNQAKILEEMQVLKVRVRRS